MEKNERTWSKIKDVDLKILDNLDEASLLNFCLTNKYSNELCNNEIFWFKRLEKNYPDIEKYKSPNRTWKNFFLSYVHYLNYGKENIYKTGYSTVEILAAKKAALNGDLDIVKYFVIVKRVDPSNISHEAAKGNYRNILDFLISKGAIWDSILYGAAEGGHLELLKNSANSANKTGRAIFWNEVLEWAGRGKGGNKEVIDYIMGKGGKDIGRALEYATDEETKKYLNSKKKSSKKKR